MEVANLPGAHLAHGDFGALHHPILLLLPAVASLVFLLLELAVLVKKVKQFIMLPINPPRCVFILLLCLL